MPLGMADLIEVFRALSGTRVIVRVDADGGEHPAEAAGLTLTVSGTLGEPRVDKDLLSLTVGDSEGESGGVLRLPSSRLHGATLSTFDGNDFFILRLRGDGISVLLQDEASGAV